MWVRPEDLVAMKLQDDSHLDKLHALRVHPKLKHKYDALSGVITGSDTCMTQGTRAVHYSPAPAQHAVMVCKQFMNLDDIQAGTKFK